MIIFFFIIAYAIAIIFYWFISSCYYQDRIDEYKERTHEK